MLGALLTLLFCLGAVGVGEVLVGRWLSGSGRLGVGGLVGLGALGTLTFFVGLTPGGLRWGLWPIVALAAAGLLVLARDWVGRKSAVARPEGLWMLFPLVLGLCILFALVGALAPSTMQDWDTLAYHLAVPKIWLAEGTIRTIPFIHHSHFPFAVDNLYIWGLTWGGEAGAKAFSVGYLIFGLQAAYGLAKDRYGDAAGWWAALAVATVPVVLWESGTAYVDVAHGLYAGLGIVFGARLIEDPQRRENAWLAAICLGFAAGSKYTGLQTITAVGFVILVAGIVRRQAGAGLRDALLVGLLAVAIGCPWYVRNEVVKGNPVFPFFYSVLGGEGWDARRAEIYTAEQKTFGVGTSPSALPHAILGLAYSPGRYVNPGQQSGQGTPLGAVGVPILAALLLWPMSGRLRRFEAAVVGVALLSLAMWFFLSQQSRYVVALALPLGLLVGGGIARLRTGPLLAAVAALQAAITLVIVKSYITEDQLRVVLGRESREEYLMPRVPLYDASRAINGLGPSAKLALYDEVFGFLLDVPYVWANPGHSTLIPYDEMQNGADYAQGMRALGFTHVYFNPRPPGVPREDAERWVAATGLTPAPRPYAGAERESLMNSFEQRWKVLLAEAVAARELTLVGQFRGGLLFRL